MRRRANGSMVIVSMLVAGMLTVSCTGSDAPVEPVAALSAYLTVPTAGRLTPQGLFPATDDPARVGELSRADAEAQAVRFVREFGALTVANWSLEAGRAISLGVLDRCARTEYAATPYDSIPPGATQAFRQQIGARWLVRFCDVGGTPVVEVVIPAVRVTEPTSFASPLESSGMKSDALSLSPERAAETAASTARALVRSTPELVYVGQQWSGHAIAWVIPVTASEQDRAGTSDGGHVLVWGQYPAFRRALHVRPGPRGIEYDTLSARNEDAGAVLVVRRRSAAPKVITVQ